MIARRRQSIRSGFTLLEVLVALGVMVVIATIAWSTVAQTMDLRDYLDEADTLNRSARVTLTRLSRELEVLTNNTSAVNTYRTVFVGKDQDDEDEIWFATRTHRRLYRDSRECDQTEITIWTEEDKEDRGKLVLYHREAPRIDQDPDKAGAILPLARSVTRFDLRYLDSKTGEWSDEWDSTAVEHTNTLPRAVQMVLGLSGPDPDDPDSNIERTFVQTVLIDAASEIKKSLLNSNGGTTRSTPWGNL